MHVDEAVLAPLRERYGKPRLLRWEGDVSERELGLATYNPRRTHDVTLFIVASADVDRVDRSFQTDARAKSARPDDSTASGASVAPNRRLALIRKPHFADGVWRPPGGGIKPGEDFVAGAEREAREETGLRVELRRYLVASEALFRYGGRELEWRTHVFLAETADTKLQPGDPEEIAAARWGTLEELAGPLRERLLATGRAFWRYRVALHDASLAALSNSRAEAAETTFPFCS